MAAASSASAEACPRLDGLPGRELAGGLRVAEAHTRAARMKGLAKLDELPERLALHIPRCRSVHTVHDALPARPDLARQGRPGRPRSTRSVPPRRLKSCLRARSVIEAQRRHRRPLRRRRPLSHECHLDGRLSAHRADIRQRSSSTAAHSPPNRRCLPPPRPCAANAATTSSASSRRSPDMISRSGARSSRRTHVEQQRADQVGRHRRRPGRRLPPQVHAPHLHLGPVALRVHRRRLQRGRLDVDRQHRPIPEPRRRDRQHAAARAPVRQRAARVELEQQLEAEPRRVVRARPERLAGVDDEVDRPSPRPAPPPTAAAPAAAGSARRRRPAGATPSSGRPSRRGPPRSRRRPARRPPPPAARAGPAARPRAP